MDSNAKITLASLGAVLLIVASFTTSVFKIMVVPTLVLIVLKATDVVLWSWAVVCAPLWGTILLGLAVALASCLIGLVIWATVLVVEWWEQRGRKE